jgi:hypothetical protein
MLTMMGAKKMFPLHLSKKKHRTTVTGTDLVNMFTLAINTVDPTSHGILYSPNKQILEESLHCHASVLMADLLQGLIRGGRFHKSCSPKNQ